MALKHQQIVKDADTRDRLLDRIRDLDLERAWVFEWKPWRRRATRSQEGLVHQWFEDIAADTGNSKDIVKIGYKNMFLAQVSVIWRGKTTWVLPSLADLDVKEMADFMDAVQADALTMGIPLLNPLEVHKR